MTFTGPAPAWATSGPQGRRARGVKAPLCSAPSSRDAAKHFKGRVDRYAIWNEPNLAHPALAPARRAARTTGCAAATPRSAGSTARSTPPGHPLGQGRRSAGAQVLFGEFAPQASGTPKERHRLRLRALDDPTRDHVLQSRSWKAAKRCPPGLPSPTASRSTLTPSPTAPPTAPSDAPTTSRSPTLDRLTGALDSWPGARCARARPAPRADGALPERARRPESGDRKLPEPTPRAAYLTPELRPRAGAPRACASSCSTCWSPRPTSELWHSAILHRDGSPQATYGGLAKASASL